MENRWLSIEPVGTEDCLWRYVVKGTGRTFEIGPPVFEIDGRPASAVLDGLTRVNGPRILSNGSTEHVLSGIFSSDRNLSLELTFRIPADNPIVRFRYRLQAVGGRTLTKESGRDGLRYLGLSLSGLDRCSEILLGEFDESVHSFRLTERPVPDRAFRNGLDLMGPLIVSGDGSHTTVTGYEHGSQVPDAFVRYVLSPDRSVALEAVKGNYYGGQVIDPVHPYETIWLQFGAVPGGSGELSRHYRAFVLKDQCLEAESRRPYIFYNTWNYQERNKWWNGKTFLDSMHLERILAEIDVAHAMGIEVFVIDTGWYEKTGDWSVGSSRFPDGLREVKARLDGYGMKMGLWFSPTQAAVSSRIARDHPGCRMSRRGTPIPPQPVWETEESYRMCLVSGYWEAFADELIRLSRDLGVSYFKWDAVGQYGCDDPGHLHGAAETPAEERADCYAFELGRYMERVVDRVSRACPGAIVDFDITEGRRSVGLGFLSVGKYFLINNGPYYQSLDDPQYAPGGGIGPNVFVFPGNARARVCRTPLVYDTWIPSVLFLTHYLPDDPAPSQLVNLASLVLGQNGIWGDLLNVSREGIGLFARILGLYKQVRDDVTESGPVITGITGGSPEVHEKIAGNGRGLVSIFAAAAGRYTYVTEHTAAGSYRTAGGAEVSFDGSGRARIDVVMKEPGAAIVFFGIE